MNSIDVGILEIMVMNWCDHIAYVRFRYVFLEVLMMRNALMIN